VLKAQGDVLRRKGDFDDARQSYNAALHLYRQTGSRQGEANSYLGIGRTALAEGNGDAARQWTEQAIALHTANNSRYDVALDCETLAEAWRLQANHERALAALRQAILHYTDIELFDRANAVRTRLGDWLEEAGQTEESLRVYRDAVELQPEAGWLRRNYANGLIKNKQLAEAAEQLYLAEQAEPDAAYLFLRRAELARAGDDRLAAQHWAAEALQRQPGWDEAQAILDWAVAPATEEGR